MKLSAFLSRHGVRFSLSITIVLVLLLNVTGLLHIPMINSLENFTYDARLNMLMPNKLDDRIVIIDIDEKSLKEQGHWPWGRNKLADLVNSLFDQYHVNVLGFDVIFAEKDESSGLKSLEEIKTHYFNHDPRFNQAIESLRPKLDYDQVFANSLKGRNVVLGYIFSWTEKPSLTGILPPPSLVNGSDQGHNADLLEATGYSANLGILQNNVITAGHFNSTPDEDGVFRKVPMLIQYKDHLYESLSLAVARMAVGASKIEAGYAEGIDSNEPQGSGLDMGLEWLKLGRHFIPVDEQALSLIPYHGPQGSFPYVSATDVLNHKVESSLLKNKIVLLGTTAPGLMDLRSTPVQSTYAGVEVHANLIAGILDNNIKQHPAYTLSIELVMLLLIGLLLSLMLPKLSPLWATAFTFATTLSVILLNLYAWHYANMVLPLASLLVMISSIYFINMSYGFFVESRGKRQLTRLFGQYVPPELVDEMAENPNKFSLEGETREMTVLFSDVRGFTTISEGLDPKQLTSLMNEFLTPMTHVIHHNRGTIDKYMGDAIMAFWGAPLSDTNHAKHALQAAMGMIEALAKLQQDFAAKGWPPINIGVGLNTGLMTVGNMGSEFRMAYTVMGDAVNLGARLESLTKNYGVHIIVSEFTAAQVPEYVYRELDIVRVKGKDKPVTIFEPIGEEAQLDTSTKECLARYHAALKYYRHQDWDSAEEQLISLQSIEPQRDLYQIYIKRIAFFKQNPPGAHWDGVFNFETK